MTERTPKKFVGLHSHSCLSIGDAIGLPQDHIDFAIENGADALALTDHGNMNGFSHQYLHAKKLKEKGVNFKAIPGVEAYFIPSLVDWHKMYQERKIEKEEARKVAEEEQDDLETSEEKNEEEEGGTVVENEEETKERKVKDPLKKRSHLVLLAKNQAGLKSLFRLVSNSYIDGFYLYPRMDFDGLKEHAKGNIIASSACMGGEPAKIIYDNQIEPDFSKWGPNMDNFDKIQEELTKLGQKFQWALGEENFYWELQFNKIPAQHLLNFHLIENSKRTGIPCIVTVDAHYARPEHWRERTIYKMMAKQQMFKQELSSDNIPKSIDELECHLYPKNAEQVWASYLETGKGVYDFYDNDMICDAIERTWSIAHEQIENPEPDRTVKLPVLEKLVSADKLDELQASGKDEDTQAFNALVSLAKEGMKTRKLEEKSNFNEYVDRLKHELQVIKELKFEKYFLTYAKIMELISENQLIGAARGSAGGSLLSYVIGITQVDPIRFGLIFERFLTKKKKGFPDIDSDFSDRDAAVKTLISYFGDENVIPVSNFAQLQVASLCKDLARLYDVPFDVVNNYTAKMKAEAMEVAKQQPGFDAQVWEFTFEVAERDSKSFKSFIEEMEKSHPKFREALNVLFKQMRTISRHAGGVIISNDTKNNMPIIKAKGGLQTPWSEGLNFRHLENFGFLKFDILGLGTLRMFEDTIRRILKKNGRRYVTFKDVRNWFYQNLHPDNNAMDDMHVYKTVYWDGKYAGIFQFIKENTQKFMAEMKPKSIQDIAIATSIFRPGPLSLKVDELFLNNRKNPETVEFEHPLLKEVFAETSGLLIFQEQLQMIYHKLAGLPLEETDSIRKAFTKKDISNKEEAERQRNILRNDFIMKCKETNDISEYVSGQIFDKMEKLVAYSFNKAHAVAYAINSYICAWFMTYHPDEWCASYLDYCSTSKGKTATGEDPKVIAQNELKALGYKIERPDINLSENIVIIKDNLILPSFNTIKHFGTAVQSELNRYRPYKTVEDLLWDSGGNWRHSKFNKRALSTIIKLEGLSSMDIVGVGKQFPNYAALHYVVVDHADELKRACSRKKNRNHEELLVKLIEEAQSIPAWTSQEKIGFFQQLAGSVDIDFIIPQKLKDKFIEHSILPLNMRTSKNDLVWGIVSSTEVKKTKTGKTFMKMRIYGQDEVQQLVFVWGYDPSKNKQDIRPYDIVVGQYDESNFGLSTFYSKVRKLKTE